VIAEFAAKFLAEVILFGLLALIALIFAIRRGKKERE
jgi:hypothetical protein